MNVRPLQVSDAPAYRALMLEGYESAADAFTSTAAERAGEPLDWWSRRISDPKGMSQAFGAFHESTLVGSVVVEYSAKEKTKHKGLIIGMYVLKPQRKLGAGRALLHAAIAHARARPGLQVLTLTVTEGNTQAVQLYESAGFLKFGIEPMAIFTGIEYKAKVHMYLLFPSHAQTAA